MLAAKWKRGKIDYCQCRQGSGKRVLIGAAAEVLNYQFFERYLNDAAQPASEKDDNVGGSTFT